MLKFSVEQGAMELWQPCFDIKIWLSFQWQYVAITNYP